MTCPTCDGYFDPTRTDQKHCNPKCRHVAAMRAWRARRGGKRTWPAQGCRICGKEFEPTHQRLKTCQECRKAKAHQMRTKRIEAGKVKPKIRRDCARLSCSREFVTANPARWFCCDNCRWLSSQKCRRECRKKAA